MMKNRDQSASINSTESPRDFIYKEIINTSKAFISNSIYIRSLRDSIVRGRINKTLTITEHDDIPSEVKFLSNVKKFCLFDSCINSINRIIIFVCREIMDSSIKSNIVFIDRTLKVVPVQFESYLLFSKF